MSLDDLKDYILYEHVFFGLDKLRKNGFITIEKQNEIRKIIEKSCSESSGDAVLEDSTSPKKAEPEAEKDLSKSREQEHEQR